MLDLLILSHTQFPEGIHQAFGTEETHQIVLQGNVETGFSRVTLTAGTTTQLVIDTAGLVTLGTDDLQTAGLFCLVIQLNIGTTACHVGGDGNGSVNTGILDDLSLQLMELRIQDIMLDALSFQHAA